MSLDFLMTSNYFFSEQRECAIDKTQKNMEEKIATNPIVEESLTKKIYTSNNKNFFHKNEEKSPAIKLKDGQMSYLQNLYETSLLTKWAEQGFQLGAST